MWIFDSYYKGCVELWGRKRGLTKASAAYPPCFYMHLKDPHTHREMIEGLESRYKVEECSFRTIYGMLDGYKIYADRTVAEKIEKQTNYAAELYNVDVRQDQRYMAERDIFPCGHEDESRFSPDFENPLSLMELQILGDPGQPSPPSQPGRAREISCIEILGVRKRRIEGPERVVISDFLALIKAHDPDAILLPYADTWIPLIVQKARRLGLDQTISRSGWFKKMASKSYWSYGRVLHKDAP